MVEHFDAFGERLPDDVHRTLEVSGAKSAEILGERFAAFARIGQGVFWVVVIAIVLARLFYSSVPLFEARVMSVPQSTGGH